MDVLKRFEGVLKTNSRGTKYIENEKGEIIARECTKCGDMKEFKVFSKGKGLGGRRGICKDCANKEGRNRTARERAERFVKLPSNKNVIRVDIDGVATIWRKCSQCKKDKEISEFGIVGKKYDSLCKSCNSARVRRRDKLRAARIKAKGKTIKSNLIFVVNERGEAIIGRSCKKCGEWHSLSDGYYKGQTTCKKCQIVYAREWKAKNPEKHREHQKRYLRNNEEYRRKQNAKKGLRKRTIRRGLPFKSINKDKILATFDYRCPLTGSEDVHLDHFIALATGHGGTYEANLVPLSAELNLDKRDRNPFEWIKTRDDIDMDRWNALVEYLAEANGLGVEEFRSFVCWCYDNPRDIETIKRDKRSSLEIWRASLLDEAV
jgi:hypothetical protein